MSKWAKSRKTRDHLRKDSVKDMTVKEASDVFVNIIFEYDRIHGTNYAYLLIWELKNDVNEIFENGIQNPKTE